MMDMKDCHRRAAAAFAASHPRRIMIARMEEQEVPRRLVMAIVPLMGAIGMTLSMPVSAHAISQCAGTTIFVNVNTGDEIRLPTTSNNSGNSDCLLGQGDASSAVTALQNALDTCYNAGLTQDGIFGPLTKTALEHAQRSEGITVDGVYGPQTRDHLDFRNLSGRTRCIGLDESPS